MNTFKMGASEHKEAIILYLLFLMGKRVGSIYICVCVPNFCTFHRVYIIRLEGHKTSTRDPLSLTLGLTPSMADRRPFQWCGDYVN